MIHHFGQQLKYLHVRDGCNDTYRDIEFHKVDQLKARDIKATSLNGIIHSAKNLRQIDLALIKPTNDATLKDTASNLIESCLLLEYISIYDYQEKILLELMDGLQCGLLKTKHISRSALKIKIETRHQIVDPSDLIFSVSTLISRMKSIQTNHYMFVWRTSSKLSKEIAEKLGKDVLLTSEDYGQNFIVVQNEGCKIEGYDETWKM